MEEFTQEDRDDHARWEADEARKKITIELTVDGRTLTRIFKAEEVANIDWNPEINSMADAIEAEIKEPAPF